MSDIRKWFIKKHDKESNAGDMKPVKPEKPPSSASASKAAAAKPPNQESQENSGRRKTSKYFAANTSEPATKQEVSNGSRIEKPSSKRRMNKIDDADVDDDDFVPLSVAKKPAKVSPAKKLKTDTIKGVSQKLTDLEDDSDHNGATETPAKGSGRGTGGRGTGSSAGGRGRGFGRGGFMNFGERKDPPHKGEKEVPEGAPDCLQGLTFVISGTLDSLEREEAEDLIKRHGGRVTGSVSKKTNYLLADEDIGGRKSEKAKELGTAFLTEDGLFEMIRSSKPAKTSKGVCLDETPKKSNENLQKPPPKASTAKDKAIGDNAKAPAKAALVSSSAALNRKLGTGPCDSLTWTEKYKPKVPNDIVGNQSIVKQLHDWLAHWNEQFIQTGQKGKRKKQTDSVSKKAVLLSGSPGIGKTTSAKLVSQMLGFQLIEVNASDTRSKADTKIVKGVGGSTSNSIKELVNNEALSRNLNWSVHPKTVLIMDEVDGMSAGDRGGVADLIASIKISKIPIICICNDRYSQKLKSLVNYCLPFNFRKPTKQQMGKRLLQVAKAEGLEVNEIAMEELADRVNGDMRMAINQLQYMSLSLASIKYDDIRKRFLTSAKDEDISPFVAVDKLFGYNGGKLKMDERIDLSMSDPDLVPLIVQENYINYRPTSASKDDNGVKRMNLLAQSAESISDGDIIGVQIRRYRQWQLSVSASFASCIVPAALLHGARETLEPGERNYNRFGGWLGKNSTQGKNIRLLEDAHVHILSSRQSTLDRETLRLDYLPLFLRKLVDPLRTLPKDAAVRTVVEFMDTYCINQEDFDTVVELSKFQKHSNPLEDVQPAVKASLTKAYKQGSDLRKVRAADLVSLPGIKKAPKKRIAAIMEPVENGLGEEVEDKLAASEEENDSDADDHDDGSSPEQQVQLDLQSDKRKGIQVQLELKNAGRSNSKQPPAGKSKRPASTGKGGKGSAAAAKKKR